MNALLNEWILVERIHTDLSRQWSFFNSMSHLLHKSTAHKMWLSPSSVPQLLSEPSSLAQCPPSRRFHSTPSCRSVVNHQSQRPYLDMLYASYLIYGLHTFWLFMRLADSTPRQTVRLPSLNLGHSLASSCLSSSTSSSRWGCNTQTKMVYNSVNTENL